MRIRIPDVFPTPVHGTMENHVIACLRRRWIGIDAAGGERALETGMGLMSYLAVRELSK